MKRAGKKVVDPAVIAKQKKTRIQVHLHHNGHRIFLGGYYCEGEANVARDYSEFLTRCCQGKNLPGGYHHDCSLEIFLEFECSPHEPFAPKREKLPIYNEKDKGVNDAYKEFSDNVRERIKEMLPHFTERVSTEKLGLLNSGIECCVTWPSRFASVSEAKKFLNDRYNDWVMLAELVKILGTERIMTRYLARLSEGSSLKNFPGDSHHQTSELQKGRFKSPSPGHFEHNTAVMDYSAQFQVNQYAASVFDVFDTSLANVEPCRINPLDLPPINSAAMPDMMSRREARRYLDKHFNDKHWLILAECVKSFEIDTVSLLFEDSSLDQVSFEHCQNYATCGDLAGPSYRGVL